MKSAPRTRTDHVEALELHAIRRLWECYGIALSRPEYRALNAAIAAGTAPPLADADNGGTIHLVTIRSRAAFVIFRPDRGIVTFLAGTPRELRRAAA
jgi:hypothetical protein